jgi:heat-inducible transcriptional repressor
MTKDRTPEELAAGGRHAEVLKSVIREHGRSGEPVASQTVSRVAGIDLSPATIRNLMAELEEWGLLEQPHTSAGRVPTDRAYRLYVDRLLASPRRAPSQAKAIDRALVVGSAREIPELLTEASRQLSQLSRQVGLVLAPDLRRVVVEHLEFVRLDGQRLVAILVARSGVVHNRILHVDAAPQQDELDRASRYLSTELCGVTLAEMRERLRARLSEERATYDRLMRRSLELGQQAIEPDDVLVDLFVDGASNLIGSPEFHEIDVIRSLFRTLEDKRTLIDLLSRMLSADGVQVVIGSENPAGDLRRCSIVASPYGNGERVMGTVGVVGARRMEYARAIALVDYLARALTRLLAGPPD